MKNEPRNKKLPPIRVTEKELDKIQQKVDAAGVTLSNYIRYTALHGKVESKYDKALVVEFFKLRGDLARLGNLFKLALSKGKNDHMEIAQKIDAQLVEINNLVKQVK